MSAMDDAKEVLLGRLREHDWLRGVGITEGDDCKLALAVLVNEETDEVLVAIPKVVTVEESVLLDGRVETRHRRDFKVVTLAVGDIVAEMYK